MSISGVSTASLAAYNQPARPQVGAAGQTTTAAAVAATLYGASPLPGRLQQGGPAQSQRDATLPPPDATQFDAASLDRKTSFNIVV